MDVDEKEEGGGIGLGEGEDGGEKREQKLERDKVVLGEEGWGLLRRWGRRLWRFEWKWQQVQEEEENKEVQQQEALDSSTADLECFQAAVLQWSSEPSGGQTGLSAWPPGGCPGNSTAFQAPSFQHQQFVCLIVKSFQTSTLKVLLKLLEPLKIIIRSTRRGRGGG